MMSGSQEPLLTPQWKVKQLQEQKQQEQNKDKKERINPIRLGDGGSLVTDLTFPSLPRTQSSFPHQSSDKKPKYGFNKAKKSQSMPTQTSWPPLPSLTSAKAAPASSATQSAWLTPKIIAEAKATNPSSPLSPSNSSDDADKITSMSKADRLRLIPKLPSKKPSGSATTKGHTPISLAQTKPPQKRTDHEERNERGMVVLGQPMFITKPKRSVSDLATSASALDMSIEGNNPSPPKLDVQTTQVAPQPSAEIAAPSLELQAESERTEPRSEEALSGDERRNISSSGQSAQKREGEASEGTPIVEAPDKNATSGEKISSSDAHNVELEEDDKNFMKELGWDPESSNGVLTDEEINQFYHTNTNLAACSNEKVSRKALSYPHVRNRQLGPITN